MHASQMPDGEESRDPYEAPAIEVLGTVEFLTAGSTGSSSDGLGGGGGLPSGIP
jgi:hypothetical protein